MAAASAPASTFRFRPIWAEVFLGVLGSAVVLGVTAVMNSYPWPFKLIENYAKANNIPYRLASRIPTARRSAWRRTRSCAAPKA